MNANSQAGYTIIEVTLFLAISGLLFLVAVLGTSGTIRSVRFSDSGRSLAAFVQKQYDDIVNGVNIRSGQEECSAGIVGEGNQTPGTSKCLLMGKLLVMRQGQSKIDIYNVLGTEPASVNYALPDDQLVALFQPKIVSNVGVSSYDIPWGAYISGSKRLSDNTLSSALLLIRSPNSSRIVSYTYKAPDSISTSILDSSNAPVLNNQANIGKQTNFCITNADNFGAPAALAISGGTNQTAANILFDRGSEDCNGQ